jgi:hypothetical protein
MIGQRHAFGREANLEDLFPELGLQIDAVLLCTMLAVISLVVVHASILLMIDIMIHTTDRRAEKVHRHLMYGIKVTTPARFVNCRNRWT